MQKSKNFIFEFSDLILLLTPMQRWQAVRRLDTSFMTDRSFILIAVVALIVLTAIFIWISYNRIIEERKNLQWMFDDCAERIGLSSRERQILLEVVSRSRLKRIDAVFTMKDAFDRGADKLIDESLAANRTAEENEQLRFDLSILREKLGFLPPSSTGLSVSSRRMSSRQIPIGKKLQIKSCKNRFEGGLDATVVSNNEMQLNIQMSKSLKIARGEKQRVRFDFGGSLWEFESSVADSDGDIIVLNHSDDVRFINRRRFLRVPVRNLAFISKFPFAKTVVEIHEGSDIFSGMSQAVTRASSSTWKPLEFVPAVVTELGGPGLRIEAPLSVQSGERILVVFKLDKQTVLSSNVESKIRIIEDIGEVKYSKSIENGFSMAVELIGLKDADIRELIRATNAAYQRAGTKSQAPDQVGGSASTVGGQWEKTAIDESVTAEGVPK